MKAQEEEEFESLYAHYMEKAVNEASASRDDSSTSADIYFTTTGIKAPSDHT